MPEGAQTLDSSLELSSKVNVQILEDLNLEVVSQLEEWTARFHAYEAICTHLYRERLPLQSGLVHHADL